MSEYWVGIEIGRTGDGEPVDALYTQMDIDDSTEFIGPFVRRALARMERQDSHKRKVTQTLIEQLRVQIVHPTLTTDN